MRYATRTHKEGIMVRLPDATDQIRLAPLRALRGVFSGVGQLLLAADRLREEDARGELESGEDQRDAPASWDGRLSSSVRLIKPAEPDAPSPRGAVAAPGGKAEPTVRKSVPAGRKPDSARKAQAGDAARAGRPAKAAKQPTRGGKNVADAKRTRTKAGNAGSRKSGRSKEVAEPPRFRSLDLTGNVRMLSDQDVADLAADKIAQSTNGAQPGHLAGPAQAGPAQAGPGQAGPGQAGTLHAGLLQPGPVQPSAAAPAAAAPVWSDAAPAWSSWSAGAAVAPEVAPPLASLPISGYDELTLPSLRARLRSLDTAELADLLAHERSHANRDDVVTMFERRIAKLADGS
jgi:hypothetical protein